MLHHILILLALTILFTVFAWLLPRSLDQAHAAGYRPMPKHWHAEKWWLAQAVCIHSREGAWNAATGNGYEGGLQFLRSTWERAGGWVDPRTGHWSSIASPREQLYRAWIIWKANGGSWVEWGTAAACHLR